MRRVAASRAPSAVLVLALALPLGGCDVVFDLDRLEEQPADQGFDNGYRCACTCTYPEGGVSVLALDVCVPPELNRNIVGADPPPGAIALDCEGRVESQIEEMSDECYELQDPTCDCVTAATPATFFDKACDAGCPVVPIDDTCSNWDPDNGVGAATCADAVDCEDFGPVCVRPTTDTQQAAPTPVSARLMGRTTTCAITSGDLTLGLDGDTESAPLEGEVYFTPADGCPPDTTCLTMDFRFATVGTIAFEGIPILGIGDTDIDGVVSTGGTQPFPLGVSSTSFLQPDTVGVSARGFENGDRHAATSSNADPLVVTFDGETCSVQGTLAGSAGDPDGESGEATVEVLASGVVVNTPPVADVIATPTLECTSPAGAEVTIDATPSADREDDIVSYGWYRGGRVGPNIGLQPVLVTQQALGPETYVLKLVDSGMQSDELTVTVDVVDTTAPTVDCGAPPTITPNATPYAFRATATDACDDGLGQAEILDFECFAINGSGLRVERQCGVDIDGDTLTVQSTAGVGDNVRWRVRSADATGNDTITTCGTVVVVPGGG